MNPSSNEASGNQAPPSLMEQGPAAANSEVIPGQSEQTAVAPENAAGPTAYGMVPPIMPTMALPVPVTDSSAAAQSSNPAVVTTNLQVTDDDGDLIEKEWVSKAKQIVEQTRDDPYKQTEELTVFKADYMQKRYGKTIKLNQ